MNDFVILSSVAVLLANLLVLGLTVKLYTEYAKDMSQRGRVKVEPPAGRP